MTSEFHKYFRKDNGCSREENADTKASLRSTWITVEILSPEIKEIKTPAGRFLLHEKDGKTVRLMRIFNNFD